jgi:hypothetical protein
VCKFFFFNVNPFFFLIKLLKKKKISQEKKNDFKVSLETISSFFSRYSLLSPSFKKIDDRTLVIAPWWFNYFKKSLSTTKPLLLHPSNTPRIMKSFTLSWIPPGPECCSLNQCEKLTSI